MPMRAVQQIMLGTVTAKENQAVQTLSAIKKAGYDGIELNGFMIRRAVRKDITSSLFAHHELPERTAHAK